MVKFSGIYLLSFLLLASCGQKRESHFPLQETEKEVPDQRIKDFRLVQTEAGTRQWEMLAKEAEIFEKKQEVLTTVMKVNFYQDKKISSVLTAERGKIDSESSDMEAEGNVKVVSRKEEKKLESQKIYWIEKERKLYSKDFVKYTSTESVITGYGLETDPELTKVIIKKEVQVEIIR